jgi:ribonuclease HI
MKFLFGMGFNLEIASNNYAEYSALLYSLVLSNILQLPSATIYTDSELILTQVKGTAMCRNDILKVLLG